MLISGFVGLGLAAKIAIGATAAAAVGVTGAGVAGAAGVLPPAAQQAFDQVVGTAIDDDAALEDVAEDTEESAGTEHGIRVKELPETASETGVENSRFGLDRAEQGALNGKSGREAGDSGPGNSGKSGAPTEAPADEADANTED